MRSVVLLPTYNERDNLPEIVPAILQAAPVDVWILDDGSPDGTGQIADALAKENPRVRVTHRPEKRGLAAAYIDGFKRALAAGYDRILEMDADFSHPPSCLPELLALSNEYDVVLGSRWVTGGGTENWPLHRKIISRGGSWYTRFWLGMRVHDVTGGFKCFRREVLAAINLDDIGSRGYAFQIEMTYRALKLGFRVTEMPFVFKERKHGASKMSPKILLEAAWRVPMLKLGVKD